MRAPVFEQLTGNKESRKEASKSSIAKDLVSHIRHWKATTEHHKTKDILHVKEMLGHRSINNTLIYTQIVTFENEDEFHSATARTVEEAKKLIEAGFEYVCDIDSCKLFRKRK